MPDLTRAIEAATVGAANRHIRITAQQPLFVTTLKLPGAGQHTDEQNEKAPCVTQGANFLSELFVTSRTLRARGRWVKPPRVGARRVGSIQFWGGAFA